MEAGVGVRLMLGCDSSRVIRVYAVTIKLARLFPTLGEIPNLESSTEEGLERKLLASPAPVTIDSSCKDCN